MQVPLYTPYTVNYQLDTTKLNEVIEQALNKVLTQQQEKEQLELKQRIKELEDQLKAKNRCADGCEVEALYCLKCHIKAKAQYGRSVGERVKELIDELLGTDSEDEDEDEDECNICE